MTIRSCFLLLSFLFCISISNAQEASEYTFQTFKDTRVINSHTVETVLHRKLDFRIGHRFGDIKTGWEGLYGLENATDILFSFEYGISDELTIGLNRTKGDGKLLALVNGHLKYRIIRQKNDNSTPLSVTFVGISSISTQAKGEIPTELNFFEKFSHRMSYTAQVLVARKFGDRFSFQIMPGYTHRNIVPNNDVNGIVTVGAAARLQINKVFGIIADATIPVVGERPSGEGEDYYIPLGIGLEIETGGHVFQVNFTNATGIIENDYIPYTQSNWADGQFRLGFTISRLFNL